MVGYSESAGGGPTCLDVPQGEAQGEATEALEAQRQQQREASLGSGARYDEELVGSMRSKKGSERNLLQVVALVGSQRSVTVHVVALRRGSAIPAVRESLE